MNPLNPKKLLLTKWTAVKPVAKQKHFLVSRVIQPELPTDPIEQVEIEAVFSKATQVIAWRLNCRTQRHGGLAATNMVGFDGAQSSPTKEIREIEFKSLNPRQYEDVVQQKWREITVKGKLFIPNNPISPKAPAMIVLHGSGGISDGRELTYGEKFNSLGMYALVIDSYLSRGVDKMPHARRLFEISTFAQASDAIAGLDQISKINEIDESKIGVIGFSFGGITSYFLNLENVTSKISKTKNRFAANINKNPLSFRSGRKR
jgi:predicted alpha/beta-fold hydrolase